MLLQRENVISFAMRKCHPTEFINSFLGAGVALTVTGVQGISPS
jgi:hypothetical protein